MLGGGAAAGFAATPHDHVAPGCFWWTARTVGEVTPGQHGCVRGVFISGGVIAEGGDAGSPSLPIAFVDPDVVATRPSCTWRPREALVASYHAVFDDGRTIIVIDACR